jgi:hypothetical protein
VREDPIISGGWIKAALVIVVAAALGVGAYVLASGANINLPDLPDVGTSAETTLSNTTLDDTTIGETTTAPKPVPSPKPAPSPSPKPQPAPSPAAPTIQQLQELNRCTQAANGDIDKITTCFDRFSSGQ